MGLTDFGKQAFGYTPIGYGVNKLRDPDVRNGYMKGGIPGAVSGHYQGKARDAQEAGLDAAQGELSKVREESYQRRMRDLNQAMKFYDPVRGELQRLYGMNVEVPKFGAEGPPTPLPKWAQGPDAMQKLNPFWQSQERGRRERGEAPSIPGMAPTTTEPPPAPSRPGWEKRFLKKLGL
jgi:hypothetical protein